MSAIRFVLLGIILLATSLAFAQTTYRWVDKTTGKTVFSDQPPPPGAKNVVKKTVEERADEQTLPYATRQAAQKFPVTLYTAANCLELCASARALLNGRGIPFSEKILKNENDMAELANKLGSDASTPSLFIGQQSIKGFEAGSWNNLLDLAGYPQTAPYGSKPAGALTK